MRNSFCIVVALLMVACLTSDAGAAGLLSVTNNNSNDPADVYLLQQDALNNGELVNTDRDHLFFNLPASMLGHDYIVTANDDKTAGPGFSIDVTFEEGTTLLLSIDSRVGDENDEDGPTLGSGIMDWVLTQGWVDTGLTWYKENEYPDNPFHVYMLRPTATSHTFYEQNDGGGRNMYSIAGVPEPSSILVVAITLGGLLIGLRRR